MTPPRIFHFESNHSIIKTLSSKSLLTVKLKEEREELLSLPRGLIRPQYVLAKNRNELKLTNLDSVLVDIVLGFDIFLPHLSTSKLIIRKLIRQQYGDITII